MSKMPMPEEGSRLPSASGRTVYTVVEVAPGRYVVLSGPGRKHPAVLPWRDVSRVCVAVSRGRPITPSTVDQILDRPGNRDSSTMCALVLAMVYPGRIQR